MKYTIYPGLPFLQKKSHKQHIFKEVLASVCNEYEVNEDLLIKKTRKREIVNARQIAMYFLKSFTHFSLKSIGDYFGGRDHTTVIHSLKTVNDLMYSDPDYRQRVNILRQRILEKL